jgi:hypothetical protein
MRRNAFCMRSASLQLSSKLWPSNHAKTIRRRGQLFFQLAWIALASHPRVGDGNLGTELSQYWKYTRPLLTSIHYSLQAVDLTLPRRANITQSHAYPVISPTYVPSIADFSLHKQ